MKARQMTHQPGQFAGMRQPSTGMSGRAAADRVALWGLALGLLNSVHWLLDALSVGMMPWFNEIFRWIALGLGGFVTIWLAAPYLRQRSGCLPAILLGLLYVTIWLAANYLVAAISLVFPGPIMVLWGLSAGIANPWRALMGSDPSPSIWYSMSYGLLYTPGYFVVGLIGPAVGGMVRSLLK